MGWELLRRGNGFGWLTSSLCHVTGRGSYTFLCDRMSFPMLPSGTLYRMWWNNNEWDIIVILARILSVDSGNQDRSRPMKEDALPLAKAVYWIIIIGSLTLQLGHQLHLSLVLFAFGLVHFYHRKLCLKHPHEKYSILIITSTPPICIWVSSTQIGHVVGEPANCCGRSVHTSAIFRCLLQPTNVVSIATATTSRGTRRGVWRVKGTELVWHVTLGLYSLSGRTSYSKIS